MEAVTVYLQNQPQPTMFSSLGCKAVSTSAHELCVDPTDFHDFVFLLGTLWKLDLDEIKNHWVYNLFADGLIDQGKCVSVIEFIVLFV